MGLDLSTAPGILIDTMKGGTGTPMSSDLSQASALQRDLNIEDLPPEKSDLGFVYIIH